MRHALVALALLSVLVTFAFLPSSCSGTRGKDRGGLGLYFESEAELLPPPDPVSSDFLERLWELEARIDELENFIRQKKAGEEPEEDPEEPEKPSEEDGTPEDPGTEEAPLRARLNPEKP